MAGLPLVVAYGLGRSFSWEAYLSRRIELPLLDDSHL